MAIIHALTAKFKALWFAQSKDTFLPQYVYKLCKEYIKGPDPRRFEPVKVRIFFIQNIYRACNVLREFSFCDFLWLREQYFCDSIRI